MQLLGIEPAPPRPPLPPANARIYIVQPGDSLEGIAKKFGLQWQVLFAANRALIQDPNLIRAGCQLVIPRSPQEEEQEDYVVQPGDTLFGLARRWGCSVDAIVARNGIEHEGLIRVGQRLRRPRGHGFWSGGSLMRSGAVFEGLP